MNRWFKTHYTSVTLCGVAALLVLRPVDAAAQALTMASNGKTISAATVVERKQPVLIRIASAPKVRLCGEEVQPGVVKIRYAVRKEVAAPAVLSDVESTDATAVDPDSGGRPATFTIPAQSDDSFVVLNVLREKVESSALGTCWGALVKAKNDVKAHADKIETATKSLADAGIAASVAKGNLENLRANAAVFNGSTTATAEISALVTKIEAARQNVVAAEALVRTREADVVELQQKLSDTTTAAEKELGAPLADTDAAIRALAGGELLKISGISVGKFKAVFYDFAARSPQSTLQMMPLGNYPVVRYGDSLAAVIANVKPRTHPHAFFLAATAQDGVVINTDPVRPTFPVGALERSTDDPPLPTARVTSELFVDIVLPVRGSYAPNQYAEVTISTERPVPDDPKKYAAVTLVDKARYPQFRALYRYNLNTGVFVSEVRSRSFQKVRTVADDPATTDVDESRFRVDAVQGKRTVKPAFGLSYYLVPVDVQAPVRWLERIVPNPTIGFGFTNPADEVYVGFSHELLRNAQLFWGLHWGVTSELVERNLVTEDRDAGAALTREIRTGKFGIGLTFNVAVISKIFK